MVESLHQSDQGVFVHMVKALKKRLDNKKLQILARRMSIVSKDFHFPDVRLPGEAFWTTEINLQGHEYRAVMQVDDQFFFFYLCI